MSFIVTLLTCHAPVYGTRRGTSKRPSVCDFNAYSARGASPLSYNTSDLSVGCVRRTTSTYRVSGTQYRNDTDDRIMYRGAVKETANVTKNHVVRL